MEPERMSQNNTTPPRRGRRFAFKANAVLSMALALALALLVNMLLDRLPPLRWNISSVRSFFRLSDKTAGLLHSLDQDVEVICFFNPRHEHYSDVRTLLREYEAESARGEGRLTVRFVDPHRELARTRELKQRYSLASTDAVVFDAGGRTKYVTARDIVEERRQVDIARHLAGEADAVQTSTLFYGEQAFSSAIQNVIQSEVPVAYFLIGHGEGDITDFSEQSGYGRIAHIMQRDNITVKPVDMGRHGGIPDDATVLVVAGPSRRLAQAEADVIADWLQKSGRLMLLQNPWTRSGLEGLMATWGVRLDADMAVDPAGTITGRELIFQPMPLHDVTRPLQNIVTIFYGARTVEPMPGHDAIRDEVQADKARVTILARTSEKGWAERDADQRPPRFDAAIDRPGPVSLAVAVEKGGIEGLGGALEPTRLVVFGDSDFVSNPALAIGAGGNEDFFMSAVNWLVDRHAIMAVAPKHPHRIDLNMPRQRLHGVFALTVFAAPVLAGLVGLAVWWHRRR